MTAAAGRAAVAGIPAVAARIPAAARTEGMTGTAGRIAGAGKPAGAVAEAAEGKMAELEAPEEGTTPQLEAEERQRRAGSVARVRGLLRQQREPGPEERRASSELEAATRAPLAPMERRRG